MILSKASVLRSPSRFGAWLRHLTAALAVVACASSTASAQYYFDGGTVNKPLDNAIAERNFRLDVYQSGTDGTEFKFYKVGTEQASITDVYFYTTDANLGVIRDGNPTLSTSGDGVVFTKDANPAHLPEGTTEIATYSAQSQNAALGVNLQGEYLAIRFSPTSADALITGLNNGTVIVGIKVQGFVGGGSESLTAVVPEPASIAMLGFSSLVGLGYAWRRRGRVVA